MIPTHTVPISPPAFQLKAPTTGLADNSVIQEKGEKTDSTKTTDTPAIQQPNRTGLPENIKAGIENLSGFSMDDVKVHYNSSKPAQLQALAYTQGTEIHIGPGQEKHIPHEAWHVVQQKQGRVKPTIQRKGFGINEEEALEREAEEKGKEAFLRPKPITSTQEPQRKTGQEKTRSAAGEIRQQDNTKPSPREVVQRKTVLWLRTKEVKPSQDVITRVIHQREGVSTKAKKEALQRDWESVPDGSIANHFISYKILKDTLISFGRSMTVSNYMQLLFDAYCYLYDTSTAEKHSGTIESILWTNRLGTYEEKYVNNAVHYLLYKICDTPKNLFYWPETTGSETTGFDRPLPLPERDSDDWENLGSDGWHPKETLDLSGDELTKLQDSILKEFQDLFGDLVRSEP